MVSVSDRKTVNVMYTQLVDAGVKADAILIMPAEYRNNTSQYFDLLTPDEHETFVDCGCYDAGTAFRFAGWCGIKDTIGSGVLSQTKPLIKDVKNCAQD